MVRRILFLGTPDFAVPSLKALVESPEYDVVGVITQPDRKAGRGQKLKPPPVKLHALESGLEVLQFPSLRNNLEAVELLAKLEVDLCVVVAYGQILTPDFFDFPRHGTLNVHASLLPAYRGAAPVVHALLNGEVETGVTIMKIDEGMDTGDILTQIPVAISSEMAAGDLAPLLASEGAKLLVSTIGGYLRGEIAPKRQDDSLATYAPMIKKEHARIDWNSRADAIHNQVRAFNPWPGANCQWQESGLKVWRTRCGDRGRVGKEPPGTVVAIRSDYFLVRCGDQTSLAVLELQASNRRRVSARDFVNGFQLETGERFH